jgi:hypothetical protein
LIKTRTKPRLHPVADPVVDPRHWFDASFTRGILPCLTLAHLANTRVRRAGILNVSHLGGGNRRGDGQFDRIGIACSALGSGIAD